MSEIMTRLGGKVIPLGSLPLFLVLMVQEVTLLMKSICPSTFPKLVKMHPAAFGGY